MFVDFNILNQLGSPSINSNTLANRPAAGQTGRLFVSIDTFALYRDNGTGWDLIGGPGTGTVTGSGAAGQVTYWTGASTVSGNNNLFWDIANERLGVGTTTPSSKVDIAGSNTLLHLKGGSNAYMMYHGNGIDEYKVGYTDGPVDYRRFTIFDESGSKEVLTIDKQSRNVGINYQYTSLADQPAYTFDVDGDIRATSQVLSDLGINVKQGTTTATPAGYSGFAANSLTNDIRWTNGTTGQNFSFVFPALPGTQLTIPNTSGTIALLSDIPSLSGYVQGSGTTNQVSKFTASGTIGNSLISDDGTVVKTVFSGNDNGLILDFANDIYQFGDLVQNNYLEINLVSQLVQLRDTNDFSLKIEGNNQLIKLGDSNNNFNGIGILIDEVNDTTKIGNVHASGSCSFGIDVANTQLIADGVQVSSTYTYANENLKIIVNGVVYYIPLYN